MESLRFLWAGEHGVFYYVPKIEDGKHIIELSIALRTPPDPNDLRQGEWRILVPVTAEVVADVKADVTVRSDLKQYIPPSVTLDFSLRELLPPETVGEYQEKTGDRKDIKVTITRDEILSALFSMENPHSLYHKIIENLSNPQKLTRDWSYGINVIKGLTDITTKYTQKILSAIQKAFEFGAKKKGVSVLIDATVTGSFFSEENLLINLQPRIEGGDIYLRCHVETNYSFPIHLWVSIPTGILGEGNSREIVSESVTVAFNTLPEVSVDVSDVMLKSLEEMLGFLVYMAKRESLERTTAPGWAVARLVEKKLVEEINRLFQPVGVRWDGKIQNRNEVYRKVRDEVINKIHRYVYSGREAELVEGSCRAVNKIEKVEVSEFDPKISLVTSSTEPPTSRSLYMFELSGKSLKYTYDINRYGEVLDITLYFSFDDEETFRAVMRTLENLSEGATDFDGFIRAFWMFYNLLLKNRLDPNKSWRRQVEKFEEFITQHIMGE